MRGLMGRPARGIGGLLGGIGRVPGSAPHLFQGILFDGVENVGWHGVYPPARAAATV